MRIGTAWPFQFALALLVVVTFWNSLGGVFLFDDFASIHQNQSIRDLWPPWAAMSPPGRGQSVAGRPLANFTLAVNYAAGGLNVGGYHVVNILLHVAATLLAFAVMRRMFRIANPRIAPDRATPIAFAIAAIWAVHPLQTEVVDYIVARTESLMAICYLSCVYASLRSLEAQRARHSTVIWNVTAIVAAALGMLSKESMVTVPIAVMLIDRALLFTSTVDAFRARRILYAGLCATWLALAALMAASPRANSAGFAVRSDAGPEVTVTGYLLNQALIVPHYFKLLVWPKNLVLDYGYAAPLTLAEVAPYAVLMLAVCSFALWLWLTRPRVGLAAILCLLLLAPTTLVPIITEAGAERRMYLPGLVAIAAIVIYASKRVPRTIHAGAAVLLVVTLMLLSVARNTEYSSTYEMWRTVVDRRPHGRAYLNLAVAANDAGRTSEVLPLLRHAVVDFPDAEHALGERLYQDRQYAEAIPHLETFLRLRSTHVQAEAARQLLIRSWTDLAIQRSEAGRLGDAHDAFLSALKLDPNNQGLLRNVAISAQTLKEKGGLPP